MWHTKLIHQKRVAYIDDILYLHERHLLYVRVSLSQCQLLHNILCFLLKWARFGCSNI